MKEGDRKHKIKQITQIWLRTHPDCNDYTSIYFVLPPQPQPHHQHMNMASSGPTYFPSPAVIVQSHVGDVVYACEIVP